MNGGIEQQMETNAKEKGKEGEGRKVEEREVPLIRDEGGGRGGHRESGRNRCELGVMHVGGRNEKERPRF